MDAPSTIRKVALTALAVVLWLATIVLGLQAIYAIRDLISLLVVSLGGSLKLMEKLAPWLVLLLGLAFVFFIIGTSEYHRKRVGQSASWKLFAWSIAVEASILILYYLL